MSDAREVAHVFVHLQRALADVLAEVVAQRAPSLVPVRRAVQALVWLPERTRGLQLSLLEVRRPRSEVSGRLAHVAVLSTWMARTAGLDDSLARDAGVAGALHGVGRVLHMGSSHAGPDAIAQTSAFAGGARVLLPATGRGRHVATRLIAATQQASPELRAEGHPIARLVAVANAYERLTNAPPIGAGYASPRALATLLEREDLSAAYARLACRTLGPYAPGTLVRLDTGETAVVRDTADESRAAPPMLIVANKHGEALDPMPLDGVPLSSVAGVVDAHAVGLNPASYLFADV